jgi:prepilin signal peptidase PulO-like enzyme (type II secretory pathway)
VIVIWSLGIALGAVIGSFIAVVIERRQSRVSIVWPGSLCATCGRGLKPYENVPIFAYLLLRGRCRTCHAAIPPLTFYVEVAGGVVGALLVRTLLERFPMS